MSFFTKALCVGAATATFATAATAATITATNLGDGAAAYAFVDPTMGTTINFDLPSVASIDAQVRSGNADDTYRSPFDFSGGAGVTGWEDLEYYAVGPDNLPNPAELAFTGGAKSIEMLWGSIDTFNGMTFFMDGVLVGSLTDADIAPTSVEPTGEGASYVLIESDMKFNSILFDSGTTNAFEFANVSVAMVPLPAGVLLLLTGMAGLGVASRRRNA